MDPIFEIVATHRQNHPSDPGTAGGPRPGPRGPMLNGPSIPPPSPAPTVAGDLTPAAPAETARGGIRRPAGPRTRSLLVQVLLVNLLLVGSAVFLATLAIDSDVHVGRGTEAIVFALATLATLLGNWLLLRRRFAPLEEMISAMEHVDLAHPRPSEPPAGGFGSEEVRRLDAALKRMIARLESERRAAGRAAIEAQERERHRIAQDLHDEVNQALTAVTLRLQASIEQAPPELRPQLTETKRLSGQAMEELLALARRLRPTVLDDHGLIPALNSQVRDFADQTRIDATFSSQGTAPRLGPEQQLVVYRVTQESLSNIAQHAQASRVRVELSFVGRTILRISDDGIGFSGGRDGSLGLSGMRERALLIGGRLTIRSRAGEGTMVELVIG